MRISCRKFPVFFRKFLQEILTCAQTLRHFQFPFFLLPSAMASADLRDELLCSICLSTFKDPVMLRCGHNFCRVCIGRVLDTQDESGVYSCPDCREEFQVRPTLLRNINLHNVAEHFLIAQQEQEEITGICCTYCVDSPVPAVRSCLHCEASLCDKHLRSHSKSPEHILSDPSTSLEKRKCSVHKKILEYYCTEDAACICVSCSLAGEHRGHRVEMLDEASEKKKNKLRNVLQKLITMRKETEERVRSLEERWRKAQEKAAGEVERVIALCTDIRRRVDNLEKKVLSEISRQEKEESLSLSALIHQLDIKKDELSRKSRHLEELCNMTDPLTVLQEPDTGDLCDPEEKGGDEDIGGRDKQPHDGDDLDVAVISHTLHTLSDVITGIRNRIYVEDPADILLDVTTAANNLLISDDLKTATWTREWQNRPETVERFQGYNQVMSRRGFTSGQHYWDVEISRSGDWMVGMCYPSIDRREYQSLIGNNNKSWSLCIFNNQYLVIHGSKEIRLRGKICSNRVRICLDYEAGQLSFYELCDPIRHLHTFTATFSEPLHAALYLGHTSYLGRDWIRICH
ncbi:E3 ubiquitin/ISG15 ligase TRIM25-like [Ranitomeya variabilis]|uniref:E3 ubiquitin/ISG15 ligase TRIM25-like n=1 Tax=Ranitomeya variabilis TaxID=490064 RepID=UPI004055B063